MVRRRMMLARMGLMTVQMRRVMERMGLMTVEMRRVMMILKHLQDLIQ